MIHPYLRPYEPYIYAALRILVGVLFAIHGMQKLFGVLGGHTPALGSQLWIGGVIELVCGAMVALGLYTSLGAFLASGTMAVAYVQFHWKLAFGAAFFPVVNKGELALVYAFVFLYIASRGTGRFGLKSQRR